MEIGQDDAHFAPGTYGIADRSQDPAEVVYQAMVRAQQRTPGAGAREHQPWIHAVAPP